MNIELTNKIVKCRKKHCCEWCDEIIIIGEKARYRSGVWHGDFFGGHQHLECYTAMCKYDEWWDGEFTRGNQLRGKTYDESHR